MVLHGLLRTLKDRQANPARLTQGQLTRKDILRGSERTSISSSSGTIPVMTRSFSTPTQDQISSLTRSSPLDRTFTPPTATTLFGGVLPPTLGVLPMLGVWGASSVRAEYWYNPPGRKSLRRSQNLVFARQMQDTDYPVSYELLQEFRTRCRNPLARGAARVLRC